MEDLSKIKNITYRTRYQNVKSTIVGELSKIKESTYFLYENLKKENTKKWDT